MLAMNVVWILWCVGNAGKNSNIKKALWMSVYVSHIFIHISIYIFCYLKKIITRLFMFLHLFYYSCPQLVLELKTEDFLK